MKHILILFLVLCNGLIYCQDQGIQIPDSDVGFFIYKASKERATKRLEVLEKYSVEELNTNSKWSYHLTVSSCRLYLEMDSSLFHFNEAYRIYPKGTCSVLRVRHNHFVKALEDERKTGQEDSYIKIIKEETGNKVFSWYLWDLPDFDEFAFINECDQNYPVKKTEPVVRDSTLNSEIIRKRDQKYRKTGDFEKQLKLDELNREFIDSLYLLKRSLEAFDEEEIEQISLVAHHSEDCDWVYKWTERLIDLYNGGYDGSSLLGPLLERMLNVKEGYCTKQDAQKRDYFIYMIKDKYPEFIEKRNLDW